MLSLQRRAHSQTNAFFLHKSCGKDGDPESILGPMRNQGGSEMASCGRKKLSKKLSKIESILERFCDPKMMTFGSIFGQF